MSWSGGSSSPSNTDGNQGVRGVQFRLDTATNAAGLTVAAVVGSIWTAATIYNRSATQTLRATFVMNPGPVNAIDSTRLVPPNSTDSFGLDSDAVESVTFQYVTDIAAGQSSNASAMTVAPAVTGSPVNVINFTNN